MDPYGMDMPLRVDCVCMPRRTEACPVHKVSELSMLGSTLTTVHRRLLSIPRAAVKTAGCIAKLRGVFARNTEFEEPAGPR